MSQVRKPERIASKQMHGFTLIELMIVTVVVAILAAIAFPSYTDYVRKTKRSDATASFVQIQQAQERWRANNAIYTSNLSDISVTAVTSSGLYDLALSSNSGTGYIATATAINGKSQYNDHVGTTSCRTLTVTVTNGSAVNTPTECWVK
jgi:type IV pilus assembly protein PilE